MNALTDLVVVLVVVFVLSVGVSALALGLAWLDDLRYSSSKEPNHVPEIDE